MVYFEDILESIQKIEEYINTTTKTEFMENSLIQDAIFRRLEVIGEAVKNISPEIKEEWEEIPWREIAGMRDVLIHQYSGIKIERIWIVVKIDLPLLKKSIINLKKSFQS